MYGPAFIAAVVGWVAGAAAWPGSDEATG